MSNFDQLGLLSRKQSEQPQLFGINSLAEVHSKVQQVFVNVSVVHNSVSLHPSAEYSSLKLIAS